MSRIRYSILVLLLPAAMVSQAAAPASSLPNVDGNVDSVGSGSISFTPRGKNAQETYTITEKTRVLRDRQAVTVQDIHNGEKVVIIGHKDNETKVADTIYLKAQKAEPQQ